MAFAFVVAPIGGAILSLGGAALGGAAALAGGAASAVGGVASGVLGGAAGLAGGAASAVGGVASGLLGLGGGQAAVPVMVGGEMGSLAAASALGVPAATGGVASGLSSIMSAVGAGVGIYGQLAQLEIAEGMTEAEKIKAQTGLMEAEALKIYAAGGTPAAPAAPIPTLSSQPIYVTPAVTPAAPNYLLYAGLAVLAYFLLRSK